ncbi:platelet-activating factor acetylhydrolase [Xylariales sp. AK1849]|nr:platelet-activating factor acetylhydrolase [Xylariales sp. AK1849]
MDLDDPKKTKAEKESSMPRPPRPPRHLRERFFHALPHYTGPYSVGNMEIELPVRQPRTFSHIERGQSYALRMDTVLFSIYYPCDVSVFTKTGNKPSRPTWLPRPRLSTCKGYAKFLNIPNTPVTAYLAATSMWTKIPAVRNAKLAGCRPGEDQREDHAERHANDQAHTDETLGGDAGEKPVFPVIFFSHGLGGSRNVSSIICGEMASNGFIVVAMEHRDGSGARSFVNMPPSTNIADPKILDNVMDNTRCNNCYLVDYIFPKNNKQDALPHNQRGVDHELRDSQIEMRMAEIEEAYYAMQLINSDQGELIMKSNLRRKGNVGSSSKGLDGINWSDWIGRMHLNEVTVMGHSFGGATTVQVIREDARFTWVGQGIALDAWGAAIPKLEEDGKKHLMKPLLAIGSEAFMHWPENFDRVMNICKDTKRAGHAPCWLMTIKGSTHLSQTDFGVLYYHWMSWLAKNMVNPLRAVSLTVNPSLEFLKRTLPDNQTFGNSWIDEGILGTDSSTTNDCLAKDNRPSDKWIAARLKIPHELRLRLNNWVRRRVRMDQTSPGVPTDVYGKPLIGVITRPKGDEVWMHVSPGKSDTERPTMPDDTELITKPIESK